MRTVIQRVQQVAVTIDGQEKSAINQGLLLLVGFEEADTKEDLEWLTHKILNLRIFDDENGVMNRSILDVQGDLLIVSQFTLHALVKKGNRPSYIKAAKPEIAVPLYEEFCSRMEALLGKPVCTGVFGANMQVSLVNDGPVTIWIDTKNRE